MIKVFAQGARYPKESQWSLLTVLDGDTPLVVRRNDSASELVGSPEYRTRVGVALPFKRPTENGMPERDESQQLYDVEDILCQRLQSDESALLVLTITGGNVKELVFYARDRGKAQLAIDAVRSEVTSHEVQNYLEDDSDWSVYREFCEQNTQ
jgi:hypothetical protein